MMRQLLAVFLAASQCWGALSFGAANTNKVNCGNAGSTLDTLSNATVMFLFRPNSISGYRPQVGKVATAFAGGYWSIYQNNAVINLELKRATTVLSGASTSSLTATTWQFIAITWSTTGGAVPAIYRGVGITPAAAITTGSPSAGAGAQTTDDGIDLLIGNETPTASASANGRIAWVGIWNRVMAIEEIQSHQFRPRVTAGSVFFKHLADTATSADHSGNAHSCVVTGATVSDHAPIGPWFGFDIRKQLGIDYENHAPRTLFGS